MSDMSKSCCATEFAAVRLGPLVAKKVHNDQLRFRFSQNFNCKEYCVYKFDPEIGKIEEFMGR